MVPFDKLRAGWLTMTHGIALLRGIPQFSLLYPLSSCPVCPTVQPPGVLDSWTTGQRVEIHIPLAPGFSRVNHVHTISPLRNHPARFSGGMIPRLPLPVHGRHSGSIPAEEAAGTLRDVLLWMAPDPPTEPKACDPALRDPRRMSGPSPHSGLMGGCSPVPFMGLRVTARLMRFAALRVMTGRSARLAVPNRDCY
jgi:hypothetical protein